MDYQTWDGTIFSAIFAHTFPGQIKGRFHLRFRLFIQKNEHMPIEIRELIVLAKLNKEDQNPPVSGTSTFSQEDLNEMKEQIIKECISRMEQMIRESEDRIEQMLENKKMR